MAEHEYFINDWCDEQLADAPAVKRPLVLLDDTRSSVRIQLIQMLGWGRMLLDKTVTLFEGEPWGFDNGAYVDWKAKRSFIERGFLYRLDRVREYGVKPKFAVVPDVVEGGMDSLKFSIGWRTRLGDEWTWYLAVQDGMDADAVKVALKDFDGIALGGTDEFKRTARLWCDMAHEAGKPFHYLRAGTLKKLAIATEVGADSLDSAFPLWTDARMRAFILHWLYGSPQKQFVFSD